MRFSERFDYENIVFVGAGGTGGFLIPNALRILGVNNLLSRFINIYIIDPDIVEQRNIVRQNFIHSDINKYKADIMADRYGQAFDIKITPITKKIQSIAKKQDILGNTLIIDTVDNNTARLFINDFVRQETSNSSWISIGNSDKDGNLIFYDKDSEYPRSGVDIWPEAFNDEVIEEERQTELANECALNAISAPQTAAINMTGAMHGVNLFYSLLTGEDVRYNIVLFDRFGRSKIINEQYSMNGQYIGNEPLPVENRNLAEMLAAAMSTEGQDAVVIPPLVQAEEPVDNTERDPTIVTVHHEITDEMMREFFDDFNDTHAPVMQEGLQAFNGEQIVMDNRDLVIDENVNINIPNRLTYPIPPAYMPGPADNPSNWVTTSDGTGEVAQTWVHAEPNLQQSDVLNFDHSNGSPVLTTTRDTHIGDAERQEMIDAINQNLSNMDQFVGRPSVMEVPQDISDQITAALNDGDYETITVDSLDGQGNGDNLPDMSLSPSYHVENILTILKHGKLYESYDHYYNLGALQNHYGDQVTGIRLDYENRLVCVDLDRDGSLFSQSIGTTELCYGFSDFDWAHPGIFDTVDLYSDDNTELSIHPDMATSQYFLLRGLLTEALMTGCSLMDLDAHLNSYTNGIIGSYIENNFLYLILTANYSRIFNTGVLRYDIHDIQRRRDTIDPGHFG